MFSPSTKTMLYFSSQRIVHVSAVLFVIFQTPVGICCADYNDTETLYQNIFSSYVKELRPGLNQNQPTEVIVKLYLNVITDLNELEGKLTTIGFFEIIWNDHRISWDPAMYGNKETLVVPEEKVWLPPLFLVNSHKSLMPMRTGELLYLSYLSNGSSFWNAGGKFESVCYADPYNYPFDEHYCNLTYYTSGYTMSDIKLQLASPAVDISFYEENGVWDIPSFIGELVLFGNVPSIRYQVKLVRKPTFFIVTLLLPIMSMEILNIFVFVLPAASGERVGYSVTLLLSFGVYLSILATSLPTSSNPDLAMICYLLLSDLMVSSMITFCTIIGLIFYDKKETEDVPPCVRRFVKGIRSICSYGNYRIHHVRNVKQQKTDSNSSTNDVDITNAIKESHLSDERVNEESSKITWKDFAHILDYIFIVIFVFWTLLANLVYLVRVK